MHMKKLGTFAGVFTPSILTILGIILFLRLGYVVGNAGLIKALVIIGLANLISVLTSVSLAAVATNLKVKGGGDYYLISRTLGLEFGGAIGIVLFLAQSVSIAFYSIGFGEVLAVLVPFTMKGLPQMIAAAAVLLLFVFVWLGADWAARFQTFIMAILFAAIVSFFVGGAMRWDTAVLVNNLAAPENAPSFWLIFAIFFPAVTGFTQGVSMSGDLKDPGKSLPNGTFAAVGISIVIYFVSAVVFAASLPGDILATDYNAMKRVAAIDSLVLAGVIAATLSSGMASFMGAPRILQSLSADRIFPFLLPFAKGAGPSNNPRRGVLLAGAIALFTIALGNLNFIAPVVSMFFLISYGLLNYATFFEARAASPSFRPTFKYYDKRLSLAGGLACLGAMLAIDIVAGIVALAFLSAIYQYLSRTAGPARWADSRRSYRFQQIRSHLLQAADAAEHPRDWRPNLLVFSDDPERRRPLLRFADWLQGDSGFATVIRIIQGEGAKIRKQKEEAAAEIAKDIKELEVDMFPLVINGPDVRLALLSLVQSFGIGPLKGNTMMSNWIEKSDSDATSDYRSRRFGISLRTAFRQGYNILLFLAETEVWEKLKEMPAEKRRIDVWWRGDATSRLMMLFAHMISQNRPWHDAKIRVLDISADVIASGKTVADLEQTLSEIRIPAEPEIVASAGPDAVAAYSEDAALVFLPFRLIQDKPRDPFGNDLSALLSRLPVTAAVLAAKDIDLSAEPEAGPAGEIAEAADRYHDACKKERDAEKAAEKASRELEEAIEAWRQALKAGESEEKLRELNKEVARAKNEAVASGRKAAKQSAIAENLAEEARRLGADIAEEEQEEPKE
ncbi:MAG: amino acid permease [Desulfobacteraceae bacterium]|nr:amino acid permease [Desulfobacteraceae bacterium]